MQKIRIYRLDIGIQKRAILIEKSWKWEKTERVELTNQKRIRTIKEKEKYKYLELLETGTIKQEEIKEK